MKAAKLAFAAAGLMALATAATAQDTPAPADAIDSSLCISANEPGTQEDLIVTIEVFKAFGAEVAIDETYETGSFIFNRVTDPAKTQYAMVDTAAGTICAVSEETFTRFKPAPAAP